MDRTRITFIVILLVAVVIALGLGNWYGDTKPFGGEFDDAGLFVVKGELTEVNSFSVNGEFKFLAKVVAKEIIPLDKGVVVTGLPSENDIVTVDIKDSRFNLFVNSIEEVQCRDTGVVVCEYTIVEDNIVIVVKEEIGSSGLPEFSGTPK